MKITRTKRLFLIVLFFLFSATCTGAFASDKASEIRLVDSWKAFFESYISSNSAAAGISEDTIENLKILVYELSLFSDSDFYFGETESTETESAISAAATSIKEAFFHAGNALGEVSSPEQFQQECSLLIFCMNNYLLSTVETNRTYIFQFVELLTIISLLSVTIILGGTVWVKNRRKMETLAEQYKQEHLVTATITKVQESERNRISHDLHDTVTQDIRTALMFVNKLDNSDSLTEEQKAIVSKIKQIDEQNMKNIRNIIRNLTPPEIETSNFTTLLAEFSSGIQETNNIPCKFYAEETNLTEQLTADQKLHIFRIVQECVNNSIKHSGASEISIIVREENDASDKLLVFLISDDGCGIEASKKKEKDDVVSVLQGGTHLGLSGMKSRATMLGAKLEIISDGEVGTLVKLSVPM